MQLEARERREGRTCVAILHPRMQGYGSDGTYEVAVRAHARSCEIDVSLPYRLHFVPERHTPGRRYRFRHKPLWTAQSIYSGFGKEYTALKMISLQTIMAVRSKRIVL